VLRAGGATLAALDIEIDPAELATAALGIGSDVPALLDIGTHRVRGRGERLERVHTPQLHVVVVSTVPSSTAATYGALLPTELRDDERTARLAELLSAGLAPAPDAMGSALEAAASRADPAVAAAVHRARAIAPEVEWHMTGSGGALFSVTPGVGAAEHLAATMRRSGFNARACRTIG
jgi:4-diphosphocytidyl-2C-methyl-D-erythritol kinase